ncbi:MAG TPA: amino acid adenylation domain-containing protein [Anaerolineales bacterium]|nr:amino acid adenylation domain-containing protein [Anaerolineales bacterium]
MQSYAILLSDTTTFLLKRLGDAKRISFQATLMGAYQVFLRRLEQRSRVVVLMPGENGHSREWTISEPDFTADESFTEYLLHLDHSLGLGNPIALADQPLSDIGGVANQNPHFQAAFGFRDALPPTVFSLQTLQTISCPLALQIVVDFMGVCSKWYYDPIHYGKDEIERLVTRFEIFCQNLTIEPDAPYSRVSLVSPAEAQKIPVTLNDTGTDDSRSDELLAMFETWVDRIPESVAVASQNGTLSYAELELRANQISHELQSAGVQEGDVIAIFLERGLDLVCAQLGVLKSGAAFAALDSRAPKDALNRIFAAVDCPIILTLRALASGLPTVPARIFFLDDPTWSVSQPMRHPTTPICPDDPACILFTSGSTGHPKAVLYLHRNLAARFSNNVRVGGVNRATVFAQSSPITSIDAIDEIFLPLVSGGRTVILPYETVANPRRLVACLSAHQVTHMLLVPSLLRVIFSAEENVDKKLSALKNWMIGGEPLTGALTREFHKKLPNAILINYYGLTEGDASYHVTSPAFEYATSVPIGRPAGNTKIYLLDEYLNLVPEGQAGEIYLAGDGLFYEYFNCPELNAERWISNPFGSDGSYARLFRTGDMGRLRPDGEIEYVGRRDRMVKVRGFRVELGEVEALLSQYPAVDQCVVVAKQPAADGENCLVQQIQIVAYAVLKHGETASSQDLRDYLQGHLPDYALPSLVLTLD